MSRIALVLTLAAVGLIAGCGGGGKSKTSDKTKPTQTATTSSTASAEQAKAPYLNAVHAYNGALRTFHNRFEADARAGNLPAGHSDDSRFRDAVFNFDGTLRKISFPPSVQTDVNAMLEANRALIADLDAQAASSSPSEFDRFTPRINQDIKQLSAASTKVSRGLGVA